MSRWYPLDDLRAVQAEMNRVFDQQSGGRTYGQPGRENVSANVWSPAVDVYEDEHEIVLRADLPGMKREEIQVEVTSEALTLHGVRRLPDDGNDRARVRLERVQGPFQRSFTIGLPIETDKISALYQDGVLEVHVPKAEAIKPKRVEVRVGG